MRYQLPKNFEEVFSEEKIADMVERLAREIEAAYTSDRELVFVGVLKGAWIFHADLVRKIRRPVTIDFIRASSYGSGTQTSGVVRILKDIEVDIRGKDILLVEEIVDSGRTLSFIKERLAAAAPYSVRVVSLLDKKERREVPLVPDFCGAECPNLFLVGYGLDWGERYRNLAGIYAVKDEPLR